MSVQINGEFLGELYENNALKWRKRARRVERFVTAISIVWFLGILFLHTQTLAWFVRTHLESSNLWVASVIMVATIVFGIGCGIGLIVISELMQKPRNHVFRKHYGIEKRIVECKWKLSEGDQESAQKCYDEEIAPNL